MFFVILINNFLIDSGSKHQHSSEWQEQKSDSDSSHGADALSPTPSPPLLPGPGESITKEVFLR